MIVTRAIQRPLPDCPPFHGGARRASGQTHSRARSHQATPTSCRPHHILTRFIHPGAHGRMETHSITSSARKRDSQAKRLRRLEIDNQLDLRQPLDRQIGRFGVLQNPPGIDISQPMRIRKLGCVRPNGRRSRPAVASCDRDRTLGERGLCLQVRPPPARYIAELCGDGAVSASFEAGLCCRGTTATRGQIYL